MSPTFRSLRNRNYRLYAMGGVVSNTGTWMQRIAQDWLVLQLFTGSAAAASTALGITTGLQFLPILLLSPYAGLIADRFEKRRVLQVAQGWMALTSVALGMLAVTGVVQSWMVYVLVLLFGIGAAFEGPARQAFVSEMVSADDLGNAVGLNSASFNLARVMGPALAGVLIAALGSDVWATGMVILVNGASYAAVILALQLMRTSELIPTEHAARGKGMIRDAVRYVRGHRDLRMLMVAIFFAGTFGMNFQMTSALMATQVYGQGASEYGLLGTTVAVGSLTGALLCARRMSKPRPRLVILAGIAFAVAEIALGLMPNYVTFVIATPLLGFFLITMLNTANTTVQLSSPPLLRGRVMALYMMVVMGGTPLGAPFIGWVGAEFGARWTLIGGGILSLAGVGLAVLAYYGWSGRPRLRRWWPGRVAPSPEESQPALAA